MTARTPTQAPTRPVASRLPSTFAKLAGDLLDTLVAEVDGVDVVAVRAERLRELDRTEELAWVRAMEALDRLIGSLRAREAAIARGEVERPAPPPVAAPPRLPKSYLPIAEAGAPTEPAPAAPPPADPLVVSTAEPVPVEPVPVEPVSVEPVSVEPAQSIEPLVDVADDVEPAAPVTTPEVPAAVDVPDDDPGPLVVEPDDLLERASADHSQTPPPEISLEGDFELDLAEVLPPPPPAPAPPPVRDDPFHERQTVILSALTDADIEAAIGAPPPPPKAAGTVKVEPIAGAEPVRPPAVPAPVAQSAAAQRDDAPRQAGWTRRAELLFDDALRLFRLGDSDGGLISLERLLVSTQLNADLVEFVDVNQDRILELYEAVLSPWKKVGERLDELGASGLGGLVRLPKMAAVLALVNGQDTVEVISRNAEARGLRKLEVIAALSQLARSKVIRLR